MRRPQSFSFSSKASELQLLDRLDRQTLRVHLGRDPKKSLYQELPTFTKVKLPRHSQETSKDVNKDLEGLLKTCLPLRAAAFDIKLYAVSAGTTPKNFAPFPASPPKCVPHERSQDHGVARRYSGSFCDKRQVRRPFRALRPQGDQATARSTSIGLSGSKLFKRRFALPLTAPDTAGQRKFRWRNLWKPNFRVTEF